MVLRHAGFGDSTWGTVRAAGPVSVDCCLFLSNTGERQTGTGGRFSLMRVSRPVVVLAAAALSVAFGAMAPVSASASNTCQSEVAHVLSGSVKTKTLAGGVRLRTWTTPDRSTRVAVASVPLKRLRRGSTQFSATSPSGGGLAPVPDLLRAAAGAIVGVNASYANTVSFVPDGPLVSQGVVRSITRRSNGPMTPRALTVDSSGTVRFGTLYTRGKVTVGDVSVPLAGVNVATPLSRGVVQVTRSGWPSDRKVRVAEPVTVVHVRAGKVHKVYEERSRVSAPHKGFLLVTADPSSARLLVGALGQPVTVSRALTGSAYATELLSAVQLGAPLVRRGKAQTECTGPADSWESRPRVIVGTSDSHVFLMTVRGPEVAKWGQYDSGVTLGAMGPLARRLGMTTAYAMDGGASTQMTIVSRSGRTGQVDRTAEMRFPWLRPVPSALGFFD